jgi:hypothetical protein
MIWRSLAVSGLWILLQYIPGGPVFHTGKASSPTFVNYSYANAGPTNSNTTSVSCASGHSALIFVFSEGSNAETMGLSTTTGNTLAQAIKNAHGSRTQTVSAWTIPNCNGTAGDYTYGDSGAQYPSLSFFEISGADTSGAFDAENVCFGTAYVSTACAVTTHGANDLVIVQMGADSGTANWVTPEGYTRVGTGEEAGFYQAGIAEGARTFPSISSGGFSATENVVSVVAIR